MKLAIIDLLGLTYDGSTLSKRGLGGSESAVILMSKELVKLGFDVTVYNNCIDKEANPGIYDGVRYIDHTQMKLDATYDVVISSRSVLPFMSDNIYAPLVMAGKHRVLWMHDTFCQGDQFIEPMVNQGFIHEIFTLSDFHTNYVLNCDHGAKRNFEVLKKHVWQTRNGAVKWLDEVDLSAKDRNHFVYNANAGKGLTPLLRIWPEIKKAIPAARLTCIGGFYKFKEGAELSPQEKTITKLMDDPNIKNLGVTFTGIIPQFEIAKILANASLMIYPTDFPETFGISSLESFLYKTPILTNVFGALEETAIDMACYKLPYSSTKNSLFPNINENEQAQKFIQMVINAYNTPYLLQQKQNYCDVVDDIYGWDTVAIQWKQHLYKKLNKFLSVDEYRDVTRINDKVARVFGRRTTSDEYKSYGKESKIVVVSPFWNAEDYIENHILSVASQDYDNYTHILIDDASTDGSYMKAMQTIYDLPPLIQDKFKLVKNDVNKGAIANQLKAFQYYIEPDDIVMLLDGDDWLVNNNTIFKLYDDLYKQGYDFTYGSMLSLVDNIPLVAQSYPQHVINSKSYRRHKFNWGIPYTHLRTFKASLGMNLDNEVFKVDGEFMRAGADNPLFYELIERASHPYAVKEIVCNYNDTNPLNDYKVRAEEQNRNANMVKK